MCHQTNKLSGTRSSRGSVKRNNQQPLAAGCVERIHARKRTSRGAVRRPIRLQFEQRRTQDQQRIKERHRLEFNSRRGVVQFDLNWSGGRWTSCSSIGADDGESMPERWSSGGPRALDGEGAAADGEGAADGGEAQRSGGGWQGICGWRGSCRRRGMTEERWLAARDLRKAG